MIEFHYNYRSDDIILSITPIILLLWFNIVNNINKILILLVIISSLIYWNNKNIYTFLFDTLAAILFIIYNLFELNKKYSLTHCIYLIIILLLFFTYSYINGQNGTKQLLYHLIFRFMCFVIFILSIS
ncbi:hypothetical protein CL656_05355 [bacterium]|nr:hypothetical protein [bacterium]